MARLVLHAGMPKTGTTAIQTTLTAEPAASFLAESGIHFARTPLDPDNAGNLGAGLREVLDSPLTGVEAGASPLAAEFADASARAQVVVFSAETIFDLAARRFELEALRGFLVQYFRDIAVALYLRDPMDYLVSRLQQSLKTGHTRTKALQVLRQHADYRCKLDNLVAVFGRENIHVRPYDRDAFPGGDIVRDFAESFLSIGPRHHGIPGETGANGNAALPAEVIEALGEAYAALGITHGFRNRLFMQRINNLPWKGSRFSLHSLPVPLREQLQAIADQSRAAANALLAESGTSLPDPLPLARLVETPESSPEDEAENLALLAQKIATVDGRAERPKSLPEALGRLYSLSAESGAGPPARQRAATPAPGPARRVLHITLHKCGSQWVRDVLTDPRLRKEGALPYSGRSFSLKVHPEPGLSLPAGTLSGPIYDMNRWEWRAWREPGDRAVVVLRDPRDRLVSLLYSILYSHKEERFVKHERQLMQAVDFDQLLAQRITNFGGTMRVYLTWLKDTDEDALVLAYEALVEDQHRTFQRVADWLGWEVSQGTLKTVVDDHAFERRTGRSRGEADSRSHHRKGIAGDWENHFLRKHGESWERLFPGVLTSLGYEDSDRWWQRLPTAHP